MTDNPMAFLDGAVPLPNSAVPMIGGRPSAYSPEIAHQICEKLAAGFNVRKIAAMEGFPPRSTIFLWRKSHPEFKEAFDLAVECYIEDLLDKVEEVAEAEGKDIEIVPAGADGSPAVIIRKDVIARATLHTARLLNLYDRRTTRLAPKAKGEADKPSGNGDGAKVVETTVIDGKVMPVREHPFYASIEAWGRVEEPTK